VLLLRSDECATRHNTPGRSQEVGSVTTNPIWILVPWAVFAVALALKFLKFGKALKRHLNAPTSSTDQFRQILERIWEQKAQKETK
jgi:hypothetical protein